MVSPKDSGLFHKLSNIALFLTVLLLCAIAAETIYRYTKPYPYSTDQKYGWRIEGSQSYHKTVEEDVGIYRNITVTHVRDGFKRWGNVFAPKKVLIVGDSFTEMSYVNNGEEWYAYLERAFPQYEFFVYGARGYGTLQEFFIVEDYIDIIDPNVIILQFHFNDFTNNVHAIELREYPLSNLALRPYLEHGQIVYRLPLPFAKIRETSWILGNALKSYDKWQLEQASKNKTAFSYRVYGNDAWEDDFTKAAIFNGQLNYTLSTTGELLSKITNRSDVPVYMFSIDPRMEQFEQTLAAQANITYIADLGAHVYRIHNNVKNTQIMNDGHWNQFGNQVAGTFLVRYFDGESAFT